MRVWLQLKIQHDLPGQPPPVSHARPNLVRGQGLSVPGGSCGQGLQGLPPPPPHLMHRCCISLDISVRRPPEGLGGILFRWLCGDSLLRASKRVFSSLFNTQYFCTLGPSPPLQSSPWVHKTAGAFLFRAPLAIRSLTCAGTLDPAGTMPLGKKEHCGGQHPVLFGLLLLLLQSVHTGLLLSFSLGHCLH